MEDDASLEILRETAAKLYADIEWGLAVATEKIDENWNPKKVGKMDKSGVVRSLKDLSDLKTRLSLLFWFLGISFDERDY